MNKRQNQHQIMNVTGHNKYTSLDTNDNVNVMKDMEDTEEIKMKDQYQIESERVSDNDSDNIVTDEI